MTPAIEREETQKTRRADATATDEATEPLAPDATTEEGSFLPDDA